MQGLRAISGVAALLTVVSGCTGTSPSENKAGADQEDIVLRMAVPWGDPTGYDEYLARRIDAVSGGAVRIKIAPGWGSSAPDNEQQVVHTVASGQMDLGETGSRIFDSLGVSSFEALSAPMLIDDHRLLVAVLQSDLQEQMLGGSGPAGVTGIGMSDYGFRRPFAVGRPLLDPTDWRGVDFGTFRSMVQEDALRALGATPVEVVGTFRDEAIAKDQIQGLQLEIATYPSLGAAGRAKYVTTNVVLWPNVGVLFANPDLLGSLSDQQRTWLQQAAADAEAYSDRQESHEQESVRAACAAGARFATASGSDLRAMQEAFASVYAGIEEDAQTAAYIQQIGVLKRTTSPWPALKIPPRCAWRAA
jgi:TRAP-type C4-dicarboxylate transport system substrate-binding protein